MKTGASRGDRVLRTLWRTRLKDGSQDLGWKAGSDAPQEPGLRPASWAGRRAQMAPRSQCSGPHPGLEGGLRLPPGASAQACILGWNTGSDSPQDPVLRPPSFYCCLSLNHHHENSHWPASIQPAPHNSHLARNRITHTKLRLK